MSLLELLASHPLASKTRNPLSVDELSTRLEENYVCNEAERERRERAKLRDELYRDMGDRELEKYVDEVFKDSAVRELRKPFIRWAKYNNVIRRLVDTRSTVYSEPARRRLGGEQVTAKYQRMVRLGRKDESMREANRKLNLHQDAWVGFRVRVTPRGQRVPVYDVVSPADFFVITTPLDRTHMVGIGLRMGFQGVEEGGPHWRVWSDTETFLTDERGRVILESWEDNDFGRIPGVLLNSVPPAARGRMLDGYLGSDMVAAHMSVWFQNILLLKESKSANKQTWLTGDVDQVPTGQTADSEHEAVAPGEGVNVKTVDRGMDLTQFRGTGDYIEERAAAAHGIAPSILRHEGASSGFEISLRRIPVHELRRDQILVFREAERELAEVESVILKVDWRAQSFSPSKFSIDYGEVQQPLSRSEEIDVFTKERKAGVTNTAEFIERRNPDLDHAGAMDKMQENIDVEVTRNERMRPLKQMNGAAGAETEPAEGGGDPPRRLEVAS